ncbi:MAG: ATP-binding protein [Sorangiineae bacterium]|nr:ATP-binding protein [Polyangiaceae bacterium]MEB2321790.1 ATP-binding protein [Sorangiineae bacterium]
MVRVTLAQRLLVAIGVVTVATTAALGLGVREAWRRTEEARFREQFAQALARLERELSAQARDLPALIDPVCAHDPLLDSALIGVKRGDLADRRLSLSLRVPELMKALRLDELVLVSSDGEILGAGREGLVGKRDGALAERLRRASRAASVRTAEAPLALEAHCTLPADGKRPFVGLYAARHVAALFDEVGRSYGVSLSLSQPPRVSDELVESTRLPELGELTVFAAKSRVPLSRALRQLDGTILALGGVTLGAALVLAMLLARGLARPIVDLSRQAREVTAGEPKPVRGGGGKELEELAGSFNKAIADLVLLRKRLAASERIAAQREIARRVAHEIKNPLAPIRAAVETLRRLRARDDPAFDEYFDEATRTVLDEVARISTIVSEFTRFARMPPPRPAPFDAVDAVRKVVALHGSSGAAVTFRAGPCPPLNADRDQLVQVVTNLIQNAQDAVKGRAEPLVEVEVSAPTPEELVIRVSDDGPGLAPEMRDRLFQPYATTKPEGTGLGLVIVQRIVVEHGGDISYADRPGGGAVLTVVLPVAGPPVTATVAPLGPPSSRPREKTRTDRV